MTHRIRYLTIALSNGIRQIPWWGMLVVPLLVVGWIVGLIFLPVPEDALVHYLSLLVVVGGFVLAVWFHVGINLRSKYPVSVLVGGAVVILLSGVCCWREFSLGMLVRLSVPIILTGLLGFYIFYFSMYRGKQLISRLQVGDRFPDFALPDSQGCVVTLASMLAHGPALTVFYKGDW
jgi:hypothetical protein